jgi:peptidoglycan hydrolase-like protein with peptidoglycan-binding domain
VKNVRRPRVSLLAGALGVAMVAVPLAAAWLLSLHAPVALGELTPKQTTVVAPVVGVTTDYDAAAKLAVQYAPARELVSSGLSGTVTAASVAAGDVVTSGTVLYAVDAVSVTAFADTGVLYRPLTLKDKGSDVTLLQRFLSGVLATGAVRQSGVYDAATRDAVRVFEKRIGITTPSGVFQPAWLVHLPADHFAIQKLSVELGSPAPAPGAPIATEVPRPDSVSLTGQTYGPDGDYVFVAAGRTLPIQRAGGKWLVKDDAALADFVKGYDTTTGAVEIDGRVRLATPTPGQSVAASSVLTRDGQVYCVVVERGAAASAPDSQRFAATRVTPVSSSIDGNAILLPTLPKDAGVVVNPGALDGDWACPSS